MNLGSLSLHWRRGLMFGLNLALTALVGALFMPRLFAGQLGGLDSLVAGIYLLLVFTGIFNLLLYMIGFSLRWAGDRLRSWAASHKLNQILPTAPNAHGSAVTSRTAIVMPIYLTRTRSEFISECGRPG